jgi:hypothetical protein
MVVNGLGAALFRAGDSPVLFLRWGFAIVPGSVVEKMLQVGATFNYSSRSFLKVRLYSL